MTLEECKEIVQEWEEIDQEMQQPQWEYIIVKAVGLQSQDVFGDPITEESPYEALSELDFLWAYGDLPDEKRESIVVYSTGGGEVNGGGNDQQEGTNGFVGGEALRHTQ